MFEIFQYDFMINAILACLLASIAFGIIGTYVLVKRIVFISGGIAHSTYGGIGLGYLVGFSPLYGAIGFGILSALFISLLRKFKFQSEDLLIGIMWSFGMALGILFISFSPGYAPNLMSYLFGNILTISFEEIITISILDVIIFLIVIIFYEQFLAITFDEEFAETLGLPVGKLYTLLLVLIALTIVILIKLVGIILVIAMLTIPPSISIRFSNKLSQMMFISVILGIIFTLIGVLISYYLNLVSGATIIVVSIIFYLISLLFNRGKSKLKTNIKDNQ
ncbi:MAG: metal ABC transporter permease [Ignavibacteriales bacterium]|nr:metal ABC transporter permease [Ignavibacteriales bacterium]